LSKLLVGYDGIIHSVDNYHIKDGKYIFDVENLRYYHFLNFMASLKSMKAKISPIIIDNTNLFASLCRNYVDAARIYGYEIVVEETQTPWRFDIEELLKRNVHNIPRESLESMKKAYEPIEIFKLRLGIT